MSKNVTLEYIRLGGRELYDVMEKKDMSEVVMKAYDILNKLLISYQVKTTLKSEEQSNFFRKEGNRRFDVSRYAEALNMYNLALLFAPKDSRALKLAYSNKSALFHKIKRYQECINDIDKCFSLNCPEDLIGKLKKRREDATRLLQSEDTIWLENEYLNLNSLLNQIPYTSTYINIRKENKTIKVVATANIKLGTEVAIEQAFVSNTVNTHKGFCYYCQKNSLNLVPCDGCCHVLFCSESCKDNCMVAYHKIECKIMDLLVTLEVAENLMFKSVIKLVSSGTWDELIEISNNIEGNKESQFDAHSIYSVLNLRDDKPFKFGQMFNASFPCAMLMKYLETIPSIFPQPPTKRLRAMKALGRIMMFIVLNCKPHLIVQAAKNVIDDSVSYHLSESLGLFPLIENFKKSCEHNVVAAFLKNRIILIANKPIECGSEITIPYVTHDFTMDLPREMKFIHSFKNNGDVCKACAENTHTSRNIKDISISWQQKEIFQKSLYLVESAFNQQPPDVNRIFSELCDALTVLSDFPQSNYYKHLYLIFNNCINRCLLHKSNNMYVSI